MARRIQALNEKKLQRHMTKLLTFCKNRKLNRPPQINEIISQNASEESNGISVVQLNYQQLAHLGPQEKIRSDQAHIIFDSQDSYSHMVIENRDLSSSTFFTKDNQSMLAKLPIKDISYITTSMDPITQFDYTSKLNKQAQYEIHIFGRLVNPQYISLNELQNRESVAPHQLGLDVWRI